VPQWSQLSPREIQELTKMRIDYIAGVLLGSEIVRSNCWYCIYVYIYMHIIWICFVCVCVRWWVITMYIQCICVSPCCIEHVYIYIIIHNYILVSLSLYTDICIRMCHCAYYAHVYTYVWRECPVWVEIPKQSHPMKHRAGETNQHASFGGLKYM
jgi:hypothetical protein